MGIRARKRPPPSHTAARRLRLRTGFPHVAAQDATRVVRGAPAVRPGPSRDVRDPPGATHTTLTARPEPCCTPADKHSAPGEAGRIPALTRNRRPGTSRVSRNAWSWTEARGTPSRTTAWPSQSPQGAAVRGRIATYAAARQTRGGRGGDRSAAGETDEPETGAAVPPGRLLPDARCGSGVLRGVTGERRPRRPVHRHDRCRRRRGLRPLRRSGGARLRHHPHDRLRTAPRGRVQHHGNRPRRRRVHLPDRQRLLRHRHRVPHPGQGGLRPHPAGHRVLVVLDRLPGQKNWTYSPLGAMSRTPKDGDVDAWVFGGTDVGGTTGKPTFSPTTYGPRAVPPPRTRPIPRARRRFLRARSTWPPPPAGSPGC